MDVLAYSPSIEVYAALVRDGSESYLDLTEDVISASVTRKQDAASTFSVRLQNPGNKYMDVFMPFDRVRVVATKLERHPLITGYLTSMPVYNLYGADVSLSGKCPLYRLECLYWDEGLYDSQKLLGYSGSEHNWESVIINLLTKIGGYSESQILIGQMPQDVIDWARALYEAKVKDIAQAEDMVRQFYEMLATSGPMIGYSSPAAAASAGGVGNAIIGSGGVGTIQIPADMKQSGGSREFDLPRSDLTEGEGPWHIQQVWIQRGSQHNTLGFCTIDGKYLIACADKFGAEGDRITWYFDNGKSLDTIKFDTKNPNDYAPAEDIMGSEWGHIYISTNSYNLIEFCGTHAIGDNPLRGAGALAGEFANARITSVTNHGHYC